MTQWLGMPPETLELYRKRLGQTFDTSGPEPKAGSWAPDAPQQLIHVMPGGNGRGRCGSSHGCLNSLRCRGTA